MTFAHLEKAGFIPSLKCLKCGGMAVLSDLLWGDLFFHVYKCPRCYAMNACPTKRSRCEKFGIITKDLACNDCEICPVPKAEGFDVKKDVCPYYLRNINAKEFREKIGLVMRDHRKIRKGVKGVDSFQAI